VKDELDAADQATHQLGCAVPEPFMALSAIPELKLTDRGLVYVNQFKIVELFESQSVTLSLSKRL
jgi:adenine deaminase